MSQTTSFLTNRVPIVGVGVGVTTPSSGLQFGYTYAYGNHYQLFISNSQGFKGNMERTIGSQNLYFTNSRASLKLYQYLTNSKLRRNTSLNLVKNRWQRFSMCIMSHITTHKAKCFCAYLLS